MKNYSKAAAGRGKTTFRTGDRWRGRKYIAVRNTKTSELNKWHNRDIKK